MKKFLKRVEYMTKRLFIGMPKDIVTSGEVLSMLVMMCQLLFYLAAVITFPVSIPFFAVVKRKDIDGYIKNGE